MRRSAAEARLDRRLDADTLREVAFCGQCPLRCDSVSLMLKMLPLALGKRVVFRRPGAKEPSFDEAWLLQLLSSVRSGDEASIAFALGSRVQRSHRRMMRNLAKHSIAALDAA